MNTEAAELLDDMGALRRRTRRDRSGYWLPLLLFGVLILAAPLVYRQPRQQSWSYNLNGPTLHVGGFEYSPFLLFSGDPLPASMALVVSLYWLGTLVVGGVVTIVWYRWRAARVGVQLPLRPYLWWSLGALAIALVAVPVLVRSAGFDGFGVPGLVVSIAVFVVGIVLVLRTAGLPRSVPRTAGLAVGITLTLVAANNIGVLASAHAYVFLFVIAAGVIGLAWAERSRLCGTIAAVYFVAALVANAYLMSNAFYRWFGIPLHSMTEAARDQLLLPGAVLVIGGLVALLTGLRHRHE